MSGEHHTPFFGRRDIGLPTLLFAFLGAPILWSVHFGGSYVAVALLCTTGRSALVVPAVLAATAVSALGSVAAGVVAWREWQRLRDEPKPLDQASVDVGGRTTVLLLMGMMGAVLFTLFIVLEGLAPLFVAPCPVVQP